MGTREQNRNIEFFKRHPLLLQNDVQRGYPLSEDQIDKYAGYWDWELLSHNPKIQWSESLIQCFHDEWHWPGLSGNTGLPWSSSFIDNFAERWDWHRISWNEALPWSIDLIDQYAGILYWGVLDTNQKLPWSGDFIRRYEDFWDWAGLSMRGSPPWSVWLIDEFADRWDWSNLSGNHSIPWTTEIIERYKKRLNWQLLDYRLPDALWKAYSSECPGKRMTVPWSIEKMTRLEGRDHDWHRIALPGLTLDHIRIHQDRWDWSVLSYDSYGESHEWPPGMIDTFQSKWDWSALSSNQNLPWSPDLITQYEDRWDWAALSNNRLIPWTMDLLIRYESLLDIDALAQHLSISRIFLKSSDAEQLIADAFGYHSTIEFPSLTSTTDDTSSERPVSHPQPSEIITTADYPQTVTVKGQKFSLHVIQPYARQDGTRSKVLVWDSQCHICGKPYQYTSPVAIDRSKFPLSCPDHRRGRKNF